MDLATLRIVVDIDSSKAASGATRATAAVRAMEAGMTSSFGRVRSATTGISGEFDRLGSRAQNLGQRMTSAFGGLSVAQKALVGVGSAAVVLGSALAASIRPAIEFESAFAGVEKTVDGTPSQLADIREGILGLSAVIPTAATDLADIAANAGQLGVAAPDVLEFTKTIALLGETTDLSFESAAQSLARFLNVTGNSAPVERIGDVIVELGNNSATTESQIVTFAGRLASAFTLAGASEDQILAIASAFSSMGVEAEAGGSSLSRVITQISDSAKIGGQDLEVFAETAGLTSEQFAELARNSPVEAFVAFASGLGEVQAQGRSLTPILKTLELDGIRTSRVLQLSALNSDQLRVSLGLAADQFRDGGAAAEEANKRFETTASRLETLQGRVTAVAIALGTPSLGLFAQGADLAGDAIAELLSILTPLGQQGVGVFRNLGEAAGGFYDVIGEPVLDQVANGLTGLTQTASGMLAALNAAGPAGTALVGLLATLRLYPNILKEAQFQAQFFALQIQETGIRATAAQTAMSGLKTALSVAPLALFAAAMIGIGDAMQEAEQAGRSFSNALESQLARAVEAVDYEGTIRATRQLEEAQRQLFAEIDNDSVVIAGRRIRDFSGTLDVLLGYLPGVSSEVLENEAAFRALDAATADIDSARLDEALTRWASNLGISKEAVFALAVETGVLQDIVSDDPQVYLASKEAVTQAAEATRELADRNTILSDKVLAGTATLDDFAELLGLTSEELTRLIERTEGVDLTDLVGGDPEKINEALDVLEPISETYEALAAQIGITSSEFQAQIAIIEDLAGAHSELRKTIDGTLSSYELVEQQQRKVNEAQKAFDEALGNVVDLETLEAGASALRTLSAEYAGSGVSASAAVAKQAEFARSLFEAAVQAGIAEDEARELIATLGLIDPVYLAEISVEGQAALDLTETVRDGLIELGDKIFKVTIDADGQPVLTEVEVVSTALGAFTDREYVAFLEANGVSADDAISESQKRAQQFAADEYVARLTADDTEADENISETVEKARVYADSDYTALLKANGFDAASTVEETEQDAIDYRDRDYTADLEARNRSTGTIDEAEQYAMDWAREYEAELKAKDQATARVSAANEELSRFRSKEITITANYVGRSSGSFAPSLVPVNVQRHGGLLGIESYEDGGVAIGRGVPDVIRAGVIAPVDRSDIYSAATPYRVFAEPSTSWEAYISGAAPRDRNRRIWERTGELLGFMRHGGFMQQVAAYQDGGITARPSSGGGGVSTISIQAPISIDLSTLPANTDAATMAAMFEDRLRQAFNDFGRQIANAT